MKKVLILIIIVLIIVGGFFMYKHFHKKDEGLREIGTNQLILDEPTIRENYFLMYIDELTKDGANTVVKGTVARGDIKLNDEISIVGLDKKGIDTKVLKIKINGEEKENAKEGDIISLVFESDVPEDYIAQGQTVIKTGTTKPVYNITTINNYISTEKNSDLKNIANIFNINIDLKCSVTEINEEKNEVNILLDEALVIDKGIDFTLKNGNEVVAKGTIME